MEIKVGSILMFKKSKNIAVVLYLGRFELKMKYLVVVNKEDMAITRKGKVFSIGANSTNFEVISDINNLSKLEMLVFGVGL